MQNFIAYKQYPFIKKNIKLDYESKKEILKNVKSTFFYKIGGVIQTNTDSILISIFVGTITVGYYSNYLFIVNGVLVFINAFFQSLKSSVGNYYAENLGSKESIMLFNSLEMINYVIISFCSVCFLVLFDDFIKLSYGDSYVLSFITLIAITLNFYTSNIRQNMWVFRETTGVFNQTKHITIVTSLLNIIFSIIFGLWWGINGVLFGTIIARMVYAFWAEPKIIFKLVFKCNPRWYFLNYLINIIILILISFMSLAICHFINFNTIINLFLKLLVVIFVTMITYFFRFYFTSEYRFASRRIKNVFKS